VLILTVAIISFLTVTAVIICLKYHQYNLSFRAVNAYTPVLRFSQDNAVAQVKDPQLKVQVIANGLSLPTSMAFLGPNDILVLEKDKGTVIRILDGKMIQQPLLDVNVATQIERCMCGIAADVSDLNVTYVFLYFTEAYGSDGGPPIYNRLYKYELADNNTKLTNPVLLLNLPAVPGPRHNGGAIIIGPDNNVYVPIGDVDGHKSQSENFKNGPPVDGTGGILRITQSGQAVPNSPLGNTYPLNLYYAYGIRNSFGIDFDPITGKLWDTENGPGYGDEINLVEPGFNSGWSRIEGPTVRNNYENSSNNYRAEDSLPGAQEPNIMTYPTNLVDFAGKGVYTPPQFTWNHTVGPTGIKFFDSNKYGIEYRDDLFVGDVHNGNLYRFKLNTDRTQLALTGTLKDKIANNPDELQQLVFGTGFGGITDLEVGPDGYLYIVSLGQGKIYRIVPER
jgi:aldose sugar dehydrogenase